jgi:hypothetical protein
MVSPEQSQIHNIEQLYFYHLDCCRDAQIKKQYVLNVEKDYFFRPELVPYLIYSTLGNHGFFGFLISSQPVGTSVILIQEKYESSSTYGSPILRWVDQACGYSFQ